MPQLTEKDEGKKVVNANGDTIGRISDFRAGRAYVDPDAGITDRIMSRLGWDDDDEDEYMLEEDEVDSITDDEVRLRH